MGPFRVLEFFSTTRNDRIFLFARALKNTYIGMILCILVDYPRIQPNIAVSKSSKKVFWVRFGFSNFCRLLETAEFFFFLGPLKTLISAWSHVFWLITQEITRKLQYQFLKKSFLGPFLVLEFFSTTRNDRIFLFARAVKNTYIGMILCILVDYPRNHPKTAVSKSLKKFFWSVSGSRIFFDYSKGPNFSFS